MQKTSPGIRAVAFDFGGVLAHFIEETTLCHMADAAGAASEVFSAALWEHRADYDRGALDAGAYWGAVLDGCGSVEPREATVEVLLELDSIGWSRINPATLRWARALKQHGYRTLIISNMAAPTYDMVIRGQLWMKHFEYVVISGWIGINKPDPGIFRRATTDLGLEPSEVLFVDDTPRNVDGARAAGLHALGFTDPDSLAAELAKQFPAVPIAGLVCRW